jgi:hypothetical protein
MAKLSHIITSSLPLLAICLSGCAKENATPPHLEHEWGMWHREKERHYRYCRICKEIEEGRHDDMVCETCKEFKALGLGFIEGGDEAHSDFAKEANQWFLETGKEHGFLYDFSTDFMMLNETTLKDYDLVMFLNNLPYDAGQRKAFERYMENGGAWIGFHVSAFTTEADSWAWYHQNFLGSGNFRTNTWNPTAERIKVETHDHPATKILPDTFMSTPNEWYGWENDLRENEDIDILLSLDDSIEDSTFPIGDKPGEMWDSGYWPVAWSNHNYNMLYINMGHNLMYYNTYEKTSKTFESEEENDFVIEGMFSLINGK